MAEPDHDPAPRCPACRATLRRFNQRLCCDECDGIFLALDDLEREIISLSKLQPEISFAREKPGRRHCPRCDQAMTECRLVVELTGLHAKLDPTLDRCATHGLWFDGEELAKVLALLYRAIDHRPASRTG